MVMLSGPKDNWLILPILAVCSETVHLSCPSHLVCFIHSSVLPFPFLPHSSPPLAFSNLVGSRHKTARTEWECRRLEPMMISWCYVIRRCKAPEVPLLSIVERENEDGMQPLNFV